MRREKVLVIAAVLAACNGYLFTQGAIYKDIGSLYLKSIHGVEETEDLNYEELKHDASKIELPRLDGFTKKKIVFDIFSKSSSSGDKNEIVNEALWKDLELFFGSGRDSSLHMFSKLDRTQTTPGQVSLARILVQPTTDKDILQKRQNAIKELVSNTALFRNIDSLLTFLKSGEEQVLAFWEEDSFVKDLLFKKLYFSNPYLKRFNENPYALEILRKVGCLDPLKSPYEKLVILSAARHFFYYPLRHIGRFKLLENLEPLGEEGFAYYSDRFRGAVKNKEKDGIISNIIEAMRNRIQEHLMGFKKDDAGVPIKGDLSDSSAYFVMGIDLETDDKETILERYRSVLKNLQEYAKENNLTSEFFAREAKEFFKDALTFKDLKLLFDRILETKENLVAGLNTERFPVKVEKLFWAGVGALCTVVAVSEALGMIPRINSEKEKIALANYLQERLIHVASFFKSLSTLNQIIITNKTLDQGLMLKGNLNSLFGGFGEKTEKLDKLIELLSTNTFKGAPSYFSLTGRVLAAYKLMLEVKEELASAFEALGEVDALMSIAKLYKEHEGSRAVYSFANYIEAERPYIHLKEFWNPFVDPNVVITNDVELGALGGSSNMILTGPNAGGKSTILKGITLNVLLAHTFGIVPSRETILTPFSKINTYLNITDDIAAGNSLFKAEVLRAQDLVNTIKHLSDKDFGFTIMDEMFSGTSPKEGEAASYVVSRFLSEFSNSMCIIATHFPMLTDLEDDTFGLFKNCKVSVRRNADGSLAYTYKLEDGISYQHIAFEILVNEGVLEDSILGEAQSLIRFIFDKYKRKFAFGLFKNCNVSIKRNADGSLLYTYKLKSADSDKDIIFEAVTKNTGFKRLLHWRGERINQIYY